MWVADVSSNTGSAIGVVIFVLLAVAVYFLPTISAVFAKHHNLAAIIVLNVLLGWSCIGWIAALVWSFTRPTPAAQQVLYNYPPPGPPPPPGPQPPA
jgi:hypothetical protein